jgi:ABC-type sugar transport system substrate-binding protein
MKRRREFTRREFIGGATGTTIGLVAGTSVLGGRSSFAQGAKAAEFEKKEWIVGFSNASETNTWRTALREAIEAEVKKHKNMKLFITDANDSPAKQVSDLEDLLAKKANGLIIGAATTDVANPILDRCEKEGIPVVIVDRKVNSEKYTTFVSSDNNFMATKALGKLIELIGDKGKIAIVQGIPGSGPAVERNAAYDALLKKHPNVKAVQQAGDWSRASGQRVIENIITANRDLVGIHFDGGEMALGGIQALRAAGITDDMMKAGKPFLTWMDGYNGGLKMIKAGIGRYTILHPPRLHGSDSVKALVMSFKGEKVPKKWPLKNPEITAANITQYVAMDKPDDYWAL